MKREDWLEIMQRLPVGKLQELAWEGQASREVALSPAEPERTGLPFGAPSAELWPLGDAEVARFGIRVRTAPADVRSAAARLAAAAIERATVPVIISHVERSGFEPLGFRVERVAAGGPEELRLQEDEIAAFWHLSIVIDLDDISHMH